jgi:hypothetical protein
MADVTKKVTTALPQYTAVQDMHNTVEWHVCMYVHVCVCVCVKAPPPDTPIVFPHFLDFRSGMNHFAQPNNKRNQETNKTKND